MKLNCGQSCSFRIAKPFEYLDSLNSFPPLLLFWPSPRA